MTTPTVEFGARTTRGRRKENQDSVLVGALPSGQWIAALADGMGGHKGGAEASRTALAELRKHLSKGDSIQSAIAAANRSINVLADRLAMHGMGTTLVGILVEGDHFTAFNVGDSRAYRLDDSGVSQITRDHSFAAEAAESGTSTIEDARRYKNALTRAIGGEERVEADVFGPFRVPEDGAVILCSDGVYRFVDDPLLAKITRSTPSPAEAAGGIVDVALARGSDDNASVVIVEFGQLARREEDLALPPPTPARPAASARSPQGRDIADRQTASVAEGQFAWPEPSVEMPSRPRLSTPTRRRRFGGTALKLAAAATIAVVGGSAVLWRALRDNATQRERDVHATPSKPAQPENQENGDDTEASPATAIMKAPTPKADSGRRARDVRTEVAASVTPPSKEKAGSVGPGITEAQKKQSSKRESSKPKGAGSPRNTPAVKQITARDSSPNANTNRTPQRSGSDGERPSPPAEKSAESGGQGHSQKQTPEQTPSVPKPARPDTGKGKPLGESAR